MNAFKMIKRCIKNQLNDPVYINLENCVASSPYEMDDSKEYIVPEPMGFRAEK